MLALRAAYALVVVAGVVWLLRAGQPLALVLLPLVAIALRRSAETGRIARAAARIRHS